MSLLNEQLLELQEHVDAAQGAEDMVEQLTEKTLTQEERITELEEEKSDLVRQGMTQHLWEGDWEGRGV